MIKLLALDLDGTLLNSKGKISVENKLAIRKAEEKGVLVTIATGGVSAMRVRLRSKPNLTRPSSRITAHF